MGSGVIPRGGQHFELGAKDLEDKWIPRIDYFIARMPFITRMGFKIAIRLLNRLWPFLFMFRFRQLVSMKEEERTRLFHKIEDSWFPWPLSMVLVKLLVFPAFYGLPEAKEAISYQERFPNHPEYTGPKD